MPFTLCFANPGEIEIEAALVLGVNAKTCDSPIGYFGTGLKYAIATLLRNGCTISIWSGTVEYKFHTVEKTTRGTAYSQVYCNGLACGFTTDLGKNWELWHAYRELESNCRDEGGAGAATVVAKPAEGCTLIIASGAPLAAVWRNRSKYFLDQGACCHGGNNRVEIYEGEGIYYKGILVMPASTKYAYNLLDSHDLTEDRTLKDPWWAQYRIGEALLQNHSQLAQVLLDESTPERRWSWPPLPAAALPTLRAIDKAGKLTPDLHAALEAAETLRDGWKWRKPNRQEQKALLLAWDKVSVTGIVSRPVRVLLEQGSVLGACDSEGNIYIAPTTFDQGAVRLVGTLIEECLHADRKLKDNTRAMQDAILDLLGRVLVEDSAHDVPTPTWDKTDPVTDPDPVPSVAATADDMPF